MRTTQLIHRFTLAAVLIAAETMSASGSASAASTPTCPLPVFGPGATYHPVINPADFTATVDNRLFLLTPGTTLIYAGTKDGKRAMDIFATTSRTMVIDGVTTRVVEDRLYLENQLAERTADYYAQDRCGNVWYFGEDTARLDHRGRVVSTDGSFRAGVDGAQAGVFMTARPQLGATFRQEWLAGQAEDTFTALQLDAAVRVPAGIFSGALRTQETTDLEPGVVDNKYFVAGIGEVKEVAVKGGTERLELVEIIR